LQQKFDDKLLSPINKDESQSEFGDDKRYDSKYITTEELQVGNCELNCIVFYYS